MRLLLTIAAVLALHLTAPSNVRAQMLASERAAPALSVERDTTRGELSSGEPGVGLALALVFPGAGHYYAGELRRGLAFTGATLGLAAVFFSSRDGAGTASDALAVASGLGIAAVYVYSVYDAPRAVRRQNARR